MSDPGCRLFVGNLSWNTTDESMRMAFEDGAGVPGSVLDSKVILDRETGRSRYVSLVSSLLVRVFLVFVLVPCATVLCEVLVRVPELVLSVHLLTLLSVLVVLYCSLHSWFIRSRFIRAVASAS